MKDETLKLHVVELIEALLAEFSTEIVNSLAPMKSERIVTIQPRVRDDTPTLSEVYWLFQSISYSL